MGRHSIIWQHVSQSTTVTGLVLVVPMPDVRHAQMSIKGRSKRLQNNAGQLSATGIDIEMY